MKEAIFEWKNWEMGNKKDENQFKELSPFDIEDILEENYIYAQDIVTGKQIGRAHV